jgi:hypothetical protein
MLICDISPSFHGWCTNYDRVIGFSRAMISKFSTLQKVVPDYIVWFVCETEMSRSLTVKPFVNIKRILELSDKLVITLISLLKARLEGRLTPYIPASLRRQIFDAFHNLSHPQMQQGK